MRARIVRAVDGRVHRVDGDQLIAARGTRIGLSDDGGRSLRWGPSLALDLRTRLARLHRLAARATRGGIHHVVPLASGALLALCGRWFVRVDARTANPIGAAARVMGSRPLVLCVARSGRVLYGEYCSNPERRPVHLFASDDEGEHWHVAHRFSDVRHVHGVFEDPRDGSFWITTGDADAESAIWHADADFTHVERVWGGSQQRRVIALLFVGDLLLSGSDTPLERNHLLAFERGRQAEEVLGEVAGSVFHGAIAGEHVLLSTACEPSAVNTSRSVEVWRASTLRPHRWERVVSFSKDLWPMRLFQYGQVFLAPGRPREASFWISPFATAQDQRSLLVQLDEGMDERSVR